MKKILKYIAVVFATGIVFNSCETTELDLTNDPNALTPSQAKSRFLFKFRTGNLCQVRRVDW